MLELLDDLAAWPYLAPVAAGVAVGALIAVLVLIARTSALRQRLRLLEQRLVDAGQLPPTRRATSTPHGGEPAGPGTPDLPGSASDATGTSLDRAGDVGAPGHAPDAGPRPAGATATPWPALDGGDRATGAAEPAAEAPAGAPSANEDGSAQLAAVGALREVAMLGRQLELLDGLEQREESPDVLVVLFQLDNLTMRLRRNAESVLILAGRESGRRAREPLSVTDTVRTACSQIDGYERVSVDATTDPLVQAASVVPLAHLIAELLENATRYSDPETQVVVQVDGDGDGVAVTIADTGIGMDDAALTDARARLLAPSVPGSGGGRIGLSVVGQLARRLGLAVDLQSGPQGTIATIRVPGRIIAAPPAELETPEPQGFAPVVDPFPAAVDAPAEPAPLPRRRPTHASAQAPGTAAVPDLPPGPWDSAGSDTLLATATPVDGAPAPGHQAAADPLTAAPDALLAPAPLTAPDALLAPDPLAMPGSLSVPGTPELLPEPDRTAAPDAPWTPEPTWAPDTTWSSAPMPDVPSPYPPPVEESGPESFVPAPMPPSPPPVSADLSPTMPPAWTPAEPPAFDTTPAAAPEPAPGAPVNVPQAPTPGPGALRAEPTIPVPLASPGADPLPSADPGTAPQDGWFVPGTGASGSPTGEHTLRDEVLAELGRLSGYRPAQSAAANGSTLERRRPAAVSEQLAANRGPADRDAVAVRRRFSAFQSGTGRGRSRQR